MTFWPLVPNWSSPVRETLEFLTEVFTSRNGKEQRRALRTTPRRTLEYESLIAGERLPALERLLVRNQVGTFQAADVTRGVLTTSAFPVSATSLQVDSAPEWLTAGAAVVLSRGMDARLLTVSSVTDLSVTFTGPADLAFGRGSRLSPAIEGRIAANFPTTRVTDELATSRVTFAPLPATAEVDEGSIDFASVFDDREVFMLRPNWVRSPDITFVQETEVVDYGRGRTQVFAPIEFTGRLHEAEYLLRSGEAVSNLKQFFARMKGRRGEFWHSTWTHDLPPLEDLAADDDTLTVAGSEVYDTFAGDIVHVALMVHTDVGAVPMRRIASITLVGGNSVVTLTEPWGYDIPTSAIRTVSWLLLTRFASDTLTIEWLSDSLARAIVATRSLEIGEAEAGPAADGDLDGAAQYLLNTFGWSFTESVLCDPFQLAVNVRYLDIAEVE